MKDRQDKEKECGQAQAEDEQVICSNELLKVIRERMQKRRQKERESGSGEPE